MRYVALFACVLALGLSIARADEKPVKEAEVPKPALDAVKKKYPGAAFKEFAREEEKGKVSYEITLTLKEKDKTRKLDVLVSPEGKIEVEEEVVGEDALPEAVKKALGASKYGKWKIQKVERIVKNEDEKDPSFELLVKDGDKKAEVLFDKDGKLVEEEDKTGKEKDD
jgi:hypothetical protein